MDPLKVVPDPSLSIKNGAIPGWRRGPRHLIIYYNLLLRKLSEWLEEPDMLTTPFNKLPERVRNIVLYGTGDTPLEFDYRMHGKKYRWSKPFEGVLENLRRRMTETESDSVRERLGEYLSPRECPACHGARLKPVSLAVTVGGLGIDKFNAQSVEAALKFVSELELDKEQAAIAGDVLKEIRSRLTFLCDVGLNYLTLDRVSQHPFRRRGGSASRLATQLGCGLVGVLYILDEPSIGCTSATTIGCSTRWKSCATSATPCWWSNTTSTPSNGPTMCSTSAPARACTAANWSPMARRRSW